MKKLLASLVIVTVTGISAHAQVTGVVNADGIIEITGTGQETAGVDLVSPGGYLVPVPGNDAAPFSFFLSNTNNQITWGNLGTDVTLDGTWVTGAGYTGPDPATDLEASWGSGGVPVSFPVTIPEPASGALFAFAALAMLGFRTRRS